MQSSSTPLIDEKELEETIDPNKIVFINIGLKKIGSDRTYIKEYLDFSERPATERIQLVLHSIQKAYDQAKGIHGDDKIYLILLRENIFEGKPLELNDPEGYPYIAQRLSIKKEKAQKISNELSKIAAAHENLKICWGGNLVRNTIMTNELQKLYEAKESYLHLDDEKQLEKALEEDKITKHEEMLVSVLEKIERKDNSFSEVVELVNKGIVFSAKDSQVFFKKCPSSETKRDSLVEYGLRQEGARPHFFNPKINGKKQNIVELALNEKTIHIKVEICRDHAFSQKGISFPIQVLLCDWTNAIAKNFNADQYLVLSSSHCDAKYFKRNETDNDIYLYNFNCYNGEFKKIESSYFFNFKLVEYLMHIYDSLQLNIDDAYLNTLIDHIKLSDFESKESFVTWINEFIEILNSYYTNLFTCQDDEMILFWCKCITLMNKTIEFAFDSMMVTFKEDINQYTTPFFTNNLKYNDTYSETLEEYVENKFENNLDICKDFVFKNKVNPFFVTYSQDGNFLCPYYSAAVNNDKELLSLYSNWYLYQKPFELAKKLESKVEFRKK